MNSIIKTTAILPTVGSVGFAGYDANPTVVLLAGFFRPGDFFRLPAMKTS